MFKRVFRKIIEKFWEFMDMARGCCCFACVDIWYVDEFSQWSMEQTALIGIFRSVRYMENRVEVW